MSERHKVAALRRGADRTAKTLQRVEEAIRAISDEMQVNGGIYPQNGGAVSMAEIARRAGINEATFYKKDNVALKVRASLWLETLKKKETVGRMRVRKTHQQRAEGWKEKHDALQNRHIVTELQLQQLQAEYEKLRHDYDALLEQMRGGARSNVAPIPKGKL
ncbi:hypothetical protein [Methylomonas sp. UP202]|uniref:hypothetical protein n=1 Tax=Methylomonas sp. UP202 TaxID=3040943 RepID=UPI00247A51B6|nr:hypothetical protein [Methylomonas sp. UP202]WGS84109.1 hypothetical protein QC632_13715 [Methylomonas sp. UP202]